jgi:hypothetical protein
VHLAVGFGCTKDHPQWGEEMVFAHAWSLVIVQHVAQRWGHDAYKKAYAERQVYWAEIVGEWP